MSWARLRAVLVPLLVLGPLLGLAGCGGSPAAGGGVSCAFPTDGNSPARTVTPPADTAFRGAAVAVSLVTSVGTLHATLDRRHAPCTVASFRSLAGQGFFDDTRCHRLTTAGLFILQCGDPTGTGRGGPGYTVPDELSGKERYAAGTIAMANTGRPNTGGSQFFLVYRDSDLPPSYTVFGRLDAAAVRVLRQVAAQGTVDGSTNAAPKIPVIVRRVTT